MRIVRKYTQKNLDMQELKWKELFFSEVKILDPKHDPSQQTLKDHLNINLRPSRLAEFSPLTAPS